MGKDELTWSARRWRRWRSSDWPTTSFFLLCSFFCFPLFPFDSVPYTLVFPQLLRWWRCRLSVMFFGVFFFCRDVCRDEGNGLRLSFFSYGFRFVLLQSPLMLASLFLGISFVCSPVSPAFLRFLVTGLSPFFFFPLCFQSPALFVFPLFLGSSPSQFPQFFFSLPAWLFHVSLARPLCSAPFFSFLQSPSSGSFSPSL